MKFSEVLQQAADSSFIHPAGKKVPATVHAAAYKKSSGGNPMIEVQFKITGGPNAGKGRPVRYYLMLEFDTTIQQVTNLGVRKGELDQLAGYEVEQAGERLAAMLVGKKGAVDLEQETYQGRLQNKIKWVNPPAGATGPQPQPKREEPEQDVTAEDAGIADTEASELEQVRRELEEARAAEARSTRSAAPDGLPF